MSTGRASVQRGLCRRVHTAARQDFAPRHHCATLWGVQLARAVKHTAWGFVSAAAGRGRGQRPSAAHDRLRGRCLLASTGLPAAGWLAAGEVAHDYALWLVTTAAGERNVAEKQEALLEAGALSWSASRAGVLRSTHAALERAWRLLALAVRQHTGISSLLFQQGVGHAVADACYAACW